jgi:tetratricopeptide (TPR) repeat protein
MLLALFAGISALPMLAQNGSLKGTTKDEDGKPITENATIELEPTGDKGKATTLQLNSKGEFYSAGVPVGNYNVYLVRNGEKVDGRGKVPIESGKQISIDFDIKKDRAAMGVTDEQLKKVEEVKKSNEKIKGLNTLLQQTRDLEKAGNYDQAIALLQPAAEQNPDKDLLWGSLGDAYRGSKKYPEAIDAYQKAIAINPNYGGYHSGLAEAYGRATPPQIDKALAEYDTAAKVEPASAGMYYFNEGAVLTNAGKSTEAVAAFDKAIAADPNRAEAYYYKGENLIAQAKLDGSKMVAPPGTAEAFQKYLEIKPDGPLAAQAKAMLASLGASVETSYGKGKPASKAGKKQ